MHPQAPGVNCRIGRWLRSLVGGTEFLGIMQNEISTLLNAIYEILGEFHSDNPQFKFNVTKDEQVLFGKIENETTEVCITVLNENNKFVYGFDVFIHWKGQLMTEDRIREVTKAELTAFMDHIRKEKNPRKKRL